MLTESGKKGEKHGSGSDIEPPAYVPRLHEQESGQVVHFSQNPGYTRPSPKKIQIKSSRMKIMKIMPTIQLITKETQTDSLAPPLPSTEPKITLDYYCQEPFQRKEEMRETEGPLSDSIPPQQKLLKITLAQGMMKHMLGKHEIDFETKSLMSEYDLASASDYSGGSTITKPILNKFLPSSSKSAKT